MHSCSYLSFFQDPLSFILSPLLLFFWYNSWKCFILSQFFESFPSPNVCWNHLLRQAGSSGRCCNPVLCRKLFINDPTCVMITRRFDTREFREIRLVTAHNRSCGKAMFSVVSICLQERVPGDHCPWCHWSSHNTGTPPQPCPTLHMFKLVQLRIIEQLL